MSLAEAVDEIREKLVQRRLSGRTTLWATIRKQIAKQDSFDGQHADIILEVIRSFLKPLEDKTIISLQGSTAEQLVQKTFPKAKSQSFPDQNAAFLEVATGRADGIVVENYLLAQFNKTNGNKLKEVAFPKPLKVEYGSYAVQKGNTALAKYLSSFICSQQKSGGLAKIYKQTIGAALPPMPACK